MKPKILSFGEIIWDIYENKKVIGGAGLNFAAHCAQCGSDSFLLSAIGNDALSDGALKALFDFEVNCRYIKKTDAPTGQCIVTLNEDGVPAYNVLSDVAYDLITVTDSDIKEINKYEYDALYFGTLIQRNHVSAKTLKTLVQRCNFKELVCDVNLRENCYDEHSVRFCFENATIIKISDEEEPLLRKLGIYTVSEKNPDAIAKAICKKYPQLKIVIITLGKNGSFAYCTEDNSVIKQKPEKIQLASTVGAGDSFIAAWIVSYLKGDGIKTAMEKASKLSGYVVSQIDAVPKINRIRKTDMHTHSEFSHDSVCPVSDMADGEISQGIDVFAVTDHCDAHYAKHAEAINMIKKSVAQVESLKKCKNIKILSGIEIEEVLWDPEFSRQAANACDYDVIITSVHAVKYKNFTEPYSQIDFSYIEKDVIYGYLDKYFDDVLETLKVLDCDIMAHLTCPLRYINGKYKRDIDCRVFEEKIRTILLYIIKHSIALEVNASGINNSYNDFMPQEWIIKMFKNLGGYLITVGSDAHTSDKAANGVDDAYALLKTLGFENVFYFEKRKPIKCKL